MRRPLQPQSKSKRVRLYINVNPARFIEKKVQYAVRGVPHFFYICSQSSMLKENNSRFRCWHDVIGYKKNRMKIYIPIIISIIFCMAYCLCINLVNIYKPIAHMDISIGILFRLSVIVMFLTLLMGMLTVRFTKRKYLIVIPIIMPILLWCSYVKLFPCSISLQVVCLYGNICLDLSYTYINFMVL